MVAKTPRGLTVILSRARAGDDRARDELIGLIYDELRRVASGLMRRERAGHTLSPTAVVHEAVIRLLGEGVFDRAADRSFLFASAARAMREVLIDHARNAYQSLRDRKKFASAMRDRLRLGWGEHVNVLVGDGGFLEIVPRENGVDSDEDNSELDRAGSGWRHPPFCRLSASCPT
jgi:hypothetical protein